MFFFETPKNDEAKGVMKMFRDSFTKVTGQKVVLDVGSFYNRFFLLPLVFDLQWQSKFSFFLKKRVEF
jgi:hypothetical protein